LAKEQKRPAFLQAAIESAIGKDQQFGCPNDPAATRWPLLWEWLTTWKAGELYVKTPPTITIRLGPGGVLASVTDRDLAKALDVSVVNLGDVFDALEAQMSSSNPAVRNIGKNEAKLRKRKTQ
jgi:hypothetical protein